MEYRTFSLLSKLWKHISKERKIQLFFSGILVFLSTISELFTIASIFPFITALSNPSELSKIYFIQRISIYFDINKESNLLVPLAIIFIIAIITSSLIRFFSVWINYKVSALIANDIGVKAYERTLYQPYKVHLSRNSSEVISNITIHVDRVEAVIRGVLQFIANFIFSLSLTVALILFRPSIAVSVAFILATTYVLIGILTREKLTENSKLISNASNSKIKALQEGLGSIRETLLSFNQPYFVSKLRASDSLVRTKMVFNLMISLFPKYAIETLGITILVLFSITYSVSNQYTESILPLLATFALGAQKLLPSMQFCYSSLANIRSMVASVYNILEMLDQSIDNYPKTKKIIPYQFKSEVVLDNLSFSYDQDKGEILKNVNLKINRGEKTMHSADHKKLTSLFIIRPLPSRK